MLQLQTIMKREMIFLLNKINEYQLDIIYVADSFGSLTQKDMLFYFDTFNTMLKPEVSIGFHLHNNMNNATGNFEYLKNILQEKDREVIFDSTLFRMGRGAGNLQTELALKEKVAMINCFKHT